ncbi:MAG: methyl-accepting chemotaxis protein [Natronospirillum sp.]|uniref:methyl-accepting chemotaxis protein n=1 Tax=Natronospirillum sp. TaxID=2812955 RepID=UPI0025D209F5|nr:methyl-accepting chemotaxis protein [Natronospirillum sp.]MCH8550871.1 methyl-accepting chemotaxis protein [Natronospirillum sp.]
MKAWSLRLKLTLGVAIMLVIATSFLILQSVNSMRASGESAIQRSAESMETMTLQSLQEIANSVASEVESQFTGTLDVTGVMAALLSGTAVNVDSEELRIPMDRGIIMRMARDTLTSQPRLQSLFIHFEENAYDGNDRFFRGSWNHSSDSGTLAVHWRRDAEGLVTEANVTDAELKYDMTELAPGVRVGEWYLCSLDTASVCVTEPFNDLETEQAIIALTTPVLVQDEFRGVVGADLALNHLQDHIESLADSVFEGASRIYLVSPGGQLVASSDPAIEPGETRLDATDPEVAQRLNDDTGALLSDNRLLAQAPVSTGQELGDWSVAITVPEALALSAVDELQAELTQGYQSTAFQMAALGLVMLVLALLVMSFWLSYTTRPLAMMGQRVAELAGAKGDLTRRLNMDRHRELITVSEGFNNFTAKLRSMITSSKSHADALVEQGNALIEAANSTQQATNAQQEEVHSIVTAMEQMSTTADEVSRLSLDNAQETEASTVSLVEAREAFERTLSEVTAVAEDMTEISQRISRVSASSNNISNIIEVIQGIAEQTNLLALNAAIEAARAGEQGRGFAVVADEVRSLAARTRDSTQQIENLIEDLHQEVKSTVTEIDRSSRRSKQTADEAIKANDKFQTVADSIESISERATQVASAAEEQNRVNEEINRSMSQINEAGQHLLTLSRSVNEASGRVGELAQKLDGQLGQLKV